MIVANPLETIAADSVEAHVLVARGEEPEEIRPPELRMAKSDFANYWSTCLQVWQDFALLILSGMAGPWTLILLGMAG